MLWLGLVLLLVALTVPLIAGQPATLPSGLLVLAGFALLVAAIGSGGHQPKALLDHEVVALREDYAAGDHTTILAKRYGIPRQRAWKIVRGLTRRSAGGPIQELPLRVGKKAVGRLLDGRTWDQYPGRAA